MRKPHQDTNLVWTCIRAIFFSLVISIPGLTGYYFGGTFSPAAFSDWDEPFYLPSVFAAGSLSPHVIFQIKNGLPEYFSIMNTASPEAIIDFLFGKLAIAFHLRPVEFQLVMDLVFALFGYIAFTFLYQAVAAELRQAELAAAVTLFFPWLIHVDFLAGFQLPFLEGFTTFIPAAYPCQPILRSIRTQISYPIFALAIGYALRAIYLIELRFLCSMLAGIFTACLLYMYFFAWGAALGFICVALTLAPLIRLSEGNLKWTNTLVTRLFPYLITAGFFSLPGLYVLIQGGTFKTFSAENLGTSNNGVILDWGSQWYLSPTDVIAALVFLFILLMLRRRVELPMPTIESRLQAFSLFVIPLAIFGLVNLQPLLKVGLSPYHFPIFYLTPLFSGLLVLFAITYIETKMIKRTIYFLVPLGILLSAQMKSYYSKAHASDYISLAAATEFLAMSTSPFDRIAVLPFTNIASVPEKQNRSFAYALYPYWVESLAMRPVATKLVGSSGDQALARELATSFLFTGKSDQLLGYCPDKEREFRIISHWAEVEEAVRAADCTLKNKIIEKNSTCTLLKRYKFDYVLWDHQIIPEIPASVSPLYAKTWNSPDKRYSLLSFNQQLALKRFCKDDVG